MAWKVFDLLQGNNGTFGSSVAEPEPQCDATPAPNLMFNIGGYRYQKRHKPKQFPIQFHNSHKKSEEKI
jgi:hypothetical protein